VAGAEDRADRSPPAVDPVRRHDQTIADAAAGRRRPTTVFTAAARRGRGPAPVPDPQTGPRVCQIARRRRCGATAISGQPGRETSPSGVLASPLRGGLAAGPDQGTSGARPVARRQTRFTSASGPVGRGQRHGQEVPAPMPARH